MVPSPVRGQRHRSSTRSREGSCGRRRSHSRRGQGRPPFLMELEASDQESLFHVTPSTLSPSSTAAEPGDCELEDLAAFEEPHVDLLAAALKEELSEPPLDVDVLLCTCGDEVTISLNLGGIDLLTLTDDADSCGAVGLLPGEVSDSTCSIDEVEDVDTFGEDDDDDVEEIVPQALLSADLGDEGLKADEEQSQREELAMALASEYIGQVIQSALETAMLRSDAALLGLKPPEVHAASTCATAEAPLSGPVAQTEGIPYSSEEPGSPFVSEASPANTPPASSRSVISSRSRRRIIGAIVRSPAPAELLASSALAQFDPTSPRAVCSSPGSRQGERAAAAAARAKGSKERLGTKKKSMAIFRLDATDEATPSRSSSLARSYEALGAEVHSLHDRAEPPSTPATPWLGAHVDWNAPAPPGAYGWPGISRVQSASALALDLGLEPPRPASGLSPLGPSLLVKSTPAVVRSASTSGAFAKRSPVVLPKRQGLLPNLPSSPSSAGSIAWSMRLAAPGAKRGGLASVF